MSARRRPDDNPALRGQTPGLDLDELEGDPPYWDEGVDDELD